MPQVRLRRSGANLRLLRTGRNQHELRRLPAAALRSPASARCTAPSDPAVVPAGAAFLRVLVAVTWTHHTCPGQTCVYVASTLASVGVDPVFAPSGRRPPPGPRRQLGYLGGAVSLQLSAVRARRAPADLVGDRAPAGSDARPPTGLVTGTPTRPGPSTVSVTVTDSAAAADTATSSTGRFGVPHRDQPGRPAQRVGIAVNLQPAATGGLAPLTWSATGLPDGLTLDVVDRSHHRNSDDGAAGDHHGHGHRPGTPARERRRSRSVAGPRSARPITGAAEPAASDHRPRPVSPSRRPPRPAGWPRAPGRRPDAAARPDDRPATGTGLGDTHGHHPVPRDRRRIADSANVSTRGGGVPDVTPPDRIRSARSRPPDPASPDRSTTRGTPGCPSPPSRSAPPNHSGHLDRDGSAARA